MPTNLSLRIIRYKILIAIGILVISCEPIDKKFENKVFRLDQKSDYYMVLNIDSAKFYGNKFEGGDFTILAAKHFSTSHDTVFVGDNEIQARDTFFIEGHDLIVQGGKSLTSSEVKIVFKLLSKKETEEFFKLIEH